MAIEIIDRGARNRVEIAPDVLANGTGAVLFHGDDNELVIGAGAVLTGTTIELGSRCAFTGAPHCDLRAIRVFANSDARASIGSFTAFTASAGLWLHEPGAILIGERCMIGPDTVLTVSDMHPMFDLDTGARLNSARDVVVGDDVWLGADVVLLKGAVVGRGSVIGWRAVVTGTIPPHCAAAGIPARVIRENVRWEH